MCVQCRRPVVKAARSVLSKIESGIIDPKSMVSGGLRPDPSGDDAPAVSRVRLCNAHDEDAVIFGVLAWRVCFRYIHSWML